jgi:hypothetical protein
MVGKLNIKLNRTPLYHLPELPQYDLLDLQGRRGRQIFAGPPAMRARPPAKPARHSPEAKPMADGPTCHCEARAGRQGEAAWGTSGQVCTDNIVILQFKNLDNLCLPYEMFTPFNSL